MKLRASILAVVCLTAAACGGGGDDKAKKPNKPTTTSSAAPPPPPALPGDAAPLTGLSLPDAAKRGRPALIVKIDNAPKARPQEGINQADIVIEEKVEDGITRLFVIFHSGDAASVGPVRSARTTDISLATPLNRPLFAYSGTNATFQRLVDQAPLVDIGIDKAPGLYRRERGRPALYNVFSRTPDMFARAPAGSGPPPPLLTYRAAGTPLELAGARPANGAHLEYLGDNVDTFVDWSWDAAAGVWKRVQNGTPHVDSAGAQVTPRNVVIQFVEYKDTGQRDRSNTIVPEAVLTGSGVAWILTDGKVVEGKWSKTNDTAVTTYTTNDGTPVPLTPGLTWIELPPIGQGRLI